MTTLDAPPHGMAVTVHPSDFICCSNNKQRLWFVAMSEVTPHGSSHEFKLKERTLTTALTTCSQVNNLHPDTTRPTIANMTLPNGKQYNLPDIMSSNDATESTTCCVSSVTENPMQFRPKMIGMNRACKGTIREPLA